jgi:DNA-binding Lrp family transcriptional regulator
MEGKPRLDRIDFRILTAIQDNGRIQNQELAEQACISPGACSQRLRRLEKAKYIRGYSADIAVDRLCKAITIHAIIKLQQQGGQREARLLDALARIPEVIDCDEISGDADFLVKFQCAYLIDYHTRINALIADPDLGIRKIESHIVLRSISRLRRSNLLHLLDESQKSRDP